jgi:hypothetical protein
MPSDLLDEFPGACRCGRFLFSSFYGLGCAHIDHFNRRFLTGPFHPNQDQICKLNLPSMCPMLADAQHLTALSATRS